jgi:UDP-glucose 4-epimerase
VSAPLLLVTGATGKVGRHAIARILSSPEHRGWRVRALVHTREPAAQERLTLVRGSIADRSVVEAAMSGVTHVLHLATCKETPETVMDVTVKGLFWLLEAARTSATLARFVLIGGDAAIGHASYARALPVTEAERHRAYPGCYALSKVLEEVMVEQFVLQYGLDACCLRAPWIMEKDDFRRTLSFGEDVFGRPRWCELVGPERAAEYRRRGTVPVMCDARGQALRRSFVHVSDLVAAIVIALEHPAARGETYQIGMHEPVDYRAVAAHLARTRSLPSVDVPTDHHSVWYDTAKARLQLGWRAHYDLARLIDEAFDYQRAADDPRVIHYPG